MIWNTREARGGGRINMQNQRFERACYSLENAK